MSDGNNEKIEVFFGNTGLIDQKGPALHWATPEDMAESHPASQRTQNLSDIINAGFAFNLGKTTFATISTRVGTYTGNYMQQNALNNLMTGVGGIAVLAASASTMSLLPIITYVGSAALHGLDYQMQITQSDIQAKALANLIGYSSSNRSRGAGGKI